MSRLARQSVMIEGREHKEVQPEGVQDKEVARDAVRQDDGRQGEEDLLKRIEVVDRAATFLRAHTHTHNRDEDQLGVEDQEAGKEEGPTRPRNASNGFMLSSYLFWYRTSSSSPRTTFEKPACCFAAEFSSRYDCRYRTFS